MKSERTIFGSHQPLTSFSWRVACRLSIYLLQNYHIDNDLSRNTTLAKSRLRVIYSGITDLVYLVILWKLVSPGDIGCSCK